MAFFQLEPHVSYGLVGSRAVFLDLRRDRYLALGAEAEEAFRQMHAADEPMLPAGASRDALLATGLFREASLRGRLAPVDVPRLTDSLLDERTGPRSGLTAIMRAWGSVSRARKRLTASALCDIVSALREDRYAAPPRGDPSAAEHAARAFLVARTRCPVERSCLLDCLALLDWLGEEAGHARLVFGVRLEPFGAHCWLQTERRLLTDAYDTIGEFAPVLSV